MPLVMVACLPRLLGCSAGVGVHPTLIHLLRRTPWRFHAIFWVRPEVPLAVTGSRASHRWRGPVLWALRRRIFGLENEYGVTCTFRGQRRLSRTRSPATCSGGWSHGAVRPASSSRTAHACTWTSAPTPSTPPRSATRSRAITHDKAGERILESLLAAAEARLHEEGIAGQIFLFKNSTDSTGNSYGCHENYLVSRYGEFQRLADVLIPFFVSRQIICGAGKVGDPSRRVLHRPAGRASGGRLLGDHRVGDHQHPRRAARRRRALPPPARDRRRLEHERVVGVPQGGGDRPGPGHARGADGDAGPDPGEPHPGPSARSPTT